MLQQTLTPPVAGSNLPLRPGRVGIARPAFGTESLVFSVACFLLLSGNGPFWRALLSGRAASAPTTWLFAGAVFLALAALSTFMLCLLSGRRTVRPLLALVLLASAAATFYMERYGIYLDRAMLRNVLATDPREAADLLNGPLAAHVALFGVLPAALLWWPRLRPSNWPAALARRLCWLLAMLALAAASLWPVFGDLASTMRNRREVRHLITPGNLVAALAGNAWGSGSAPTGPRIVVGPDARLNPAAWARRERPVLFVLVLGETGRAANFSLAGYGRDTNPELSRRDVISFSQVKACGTSTEVSVPCMFSPFGRAHYDEQKIRSHESLLHVLARAGFQVLWRDNQSGCKGVCQGLPSEQLDDARVEALCAEGQCLDEVMLHGMEGIARDAAGNLFVVMHQMGSHGPAYFKRYPAVLKRFTPACESADLRHCSEAEIRNAYDNSVLYTDHFVARVVDFLGQAQKRYDTAMIYVSDHGESLGEHGLYLHGMPYAIAPEVQTHVPMVMWLSERFRRSFGVNAECLRNQAAAPASHDNLFHSVLGVLDIQTSAYQRQLDLFAPCRTAARS